MLSVDGAVFLPVTSCLETWVLVTTGLKSRHPRESDVGNVISSLFLTALPVCTLPLWRSVGAACVVIVSNPSIVGGI